MPAPAMTPGPNTLYYGDNLPILREYLADESVDLIYLDPPFNSNRSYNVLYREESGNESTAQITAFDDTWHWGVEAEQTYLELVTTAEARVAAVIVSLREFVGPNQMLAYLVMMAARLVELKRVLKPTGSLYLHCDPTASHYLKIVLDAVFGTDRFINEITWKRTTAHSSSKKFAPIHDIILYYGKSDNVQWNDPRAEYDEEYLDKYYRFDDGDGRLYWRADLCAAGVRKGRSGLPWRGIDPTAKGMHWKYAVEKLDELDAAGRIYWPPKGTMPQYKRYRDELKGKAIPDIWDDIDRINPVAAERMGYPTQKPVALLERIIAASSNPGDIVLDPFCGCGTTIAAAQKLGRRWIGIDITHLSIGLMKHRLKDAFGLVARRDYDVKGEPEDLAGARQLAQDDRFQFQVWALGLAAARTVGDASKKGGDKGIDGVVYFVDGDGKKPRRAIAQVKSGKVQPTDVRDLRGVIEREGAAIGLFITLEAASREMLTEAAAAGFYHSPLWNRDYPRLQVLTIADLLAGAEPKLPPSNVTFKPAERERGGDPGTQGRLPEMRG